MKVARLENPVRLSWIMDQGARLDAPPFLSEGMDARAILRRFPPSRIQLLSALVARDGAGIYHAGRIPRHWVEDPRFGVRFLSSSDMLKADLSHLAIISNRAVAANPLLIIKRDWTLVSRSGCIGNTVYARAEMDSLACSEDVLRIVPARAKVRPGYLYAWLSSRFGQALLKGGTYGAIIQHLEPVHIADLPVPRFSDRLELEIHDCVQRAADQRGTAAKLKAAARLQALTELGLDEAEALVPTTRAASFTVPVREIQASCRLEGGFHHPSAIVARDRLRAARASEHRRLGSVARVFTPGIFKRPHVDDPNAGYPYFSGTELFQLDPEPRGFLAKKAPGIRKYLVERDWLLVQDAGQLGGLIGRVVRVASQWDGSVVSNHLMRIAAESETDAGYLFCLLTSMFGYLAVTRNAFGGSIPQLDPAHIQDIVIPWPNDEVRATLGELMVKVWELEDSARDSERLARTLIERAVEAET